MKKFAIVASAVAALVCAVSLMAAPGEAKSKKKPAEAAQTYARPAGYHDLGGPMKSGKECWKDRDPWANTGQGYYAKC